MSIMQALMAYNSLALSDDTTMSYCLVFDEFDNPTYLKKVGNWVITFDTHQTHAEQTRLALTSVLPRSVDSGLQIRRIIIQQHSIENHWIIQLIEAFDSEQNQEITLSLEDPNTQTSIQQILAEFARYDVCIQLLKLEA